MKIVVTALIVLAAVVAVVLLVAANGMIEVAADRPHAGLTDWYLEMARESAIEGQLATITVPNLGKDRAAAAAVAYHDMCAGCHGAPGSEPGVVGKGLNPKPPDLAAEDWSEAGHQAEAFWVLKHGIRMTGMPAFGVTHDDRALWDLVAFLERLPGLDGASYARMKGGGFSEGHEDHEHGAGGPEGSEPNEEGHGGHDHG